MPTKIHYDQYWLITTRLGEIKVAPSIDDYGNRSVTVIIDGEIKTGFLLSEFAARSMQRVLDEISFGWNLNDRHARIQATDNGVAVRKAIKNLLNETH